MKRGWVVEELFHFIITVHKDMTERLPEIDREAFDQVKRILENNKAERHLRGGEATRQKYAHKDHDDNE